MNDLEFVTRTAEEKKSLILDVSGAIWGYAELPYAEYKSSALLCKVLRGEGFTVKENAADIPTAFTASFTHKQGGRVMGFLGEYDALDALSQKAGEPVRAPVKEGAPGHGCGHNALGAGALGAALILKEYLVKQDIPGTVVYYGCAAEEGAGAKQFMARAGLFDGADFIYTWHPATKNGVDASRSSAIMGANFEFRGISAHAGSTPYLGRSALDAAELMNVGVNYLREHTINEARIHYAYADAGGTAPNVVQDRTLLKYEVRSPKSAQAKELFARVVNIARGASLMTDTRMDYEVTMAFSDYIPNDALARVADECMREIGAPQWDEEDYALARAFLATYNEETLAVIKEKIAETYGAGKVDEIMKRPLDSTVQPYDPSKIEISGGSTDVGDVTYAVPALNLRVATACVGNVGHTWQMTAQAGSRIAQKGLLTAAKALALSAVRTMQRPDVIEKAKEIVLRQNGGKYQCPLPDDVTPPVGRY
jgi:aminobenzoyl-glutamate utilization protein B